MQKYVDRNTPNMEICYLCSLSRPSRRAGVTHHGPPKEAVATARAKVGARAAAWRMREQPGGKPNPWGYGGTIPVDSLLPALFYHVLPSHGGETKS